MKKKQLAIATLLAIALGLGACSNENEASISSVGITPTIDTAIDGIQITHGIYTFDNVNTAAKTEIAYPVKNLEMADGLYNVAFIGKGKYLQGEETVEVDIQGVQPGVTVTGGFIRIELKVYVRNAESGNGFLIAEVFVPGTYNETGKQYNGDQYVRICNNSDKVQYADRLIFIESAFMTTSKYKSVAPNVMNEAFAVGAVVVVPGNGTDYPIQPGESFIICDNAINHREANPNSIDLSKADFEWYIESKQDVDNPSVPNMDIYYCSTKTIWILNKQGNKAYAIGRLPADVSKDAYIAKYKYDYVYTLESGTISKPQSKYKFPNEWIIDAVNIGAVNEWQWNVTSTTLDMGHTYIGTNNTIAENIGKCVLRKVAYKEGNRQVLQDTNNSSVDFIPKGTPTLF